MNKIFLVFLIGAFIFSATLQAKSRQPAQTTYGAKCGLADTWGDFDDTSTTYDLSRSTRQVKSLPKIVKSQLIASANVGESTPITDAVKAAEVLRKASEGEELYIKRVEHNRKKFSVVSFYGGGNHTGFIFPWGSSVILAQISDDDIVCEK